MVARHRLRGQRTINDRAEASRVLRTTAAISGGSHYALRPCIDRHPDALWLPLGVDTKLFYAPVKRPLASSARGEHQSRQRPADALASLAAGTPSQSRCSVGLHRNGHNGEELAANRGPD